MDNASTNTQGNQAGRNTQVIDELVNVMLNGSVINKSSHWISS